MYIDQNLILPNRFAIFFYPVTSAIECYQCNSEYDPRCGDPFDEYSIGKVNCSLKPPLEHLPGQTPVLCRKTTQKSKPTANRTKTGRCVCFYLYLEMIYLYLDLVLLSVFGKIRVVRDCGYIHSEFDDKGCVKRTGTFEVQNRFCSCTDDLCNAAPTVHQSTIFIVVALIIGLIATFKRK